MSYELDEFGIGAVQRLDNKLHEQQNHLVGISRALDKLAGKRPGKERSNPADLIVRRAVCELLRPFRQTSSGLSYDKTADEVARQLYPAERGLHDYLQRAATSPANTTTTGNAAELIGTSVVALLAGYSPSGFSQLASQVLTVSPQGSIKVSYRAQPVALAGGWIGEGAPKPVYSIPVSDAAMKPHKLVALSVWTEEIQQYAIVDIEALIRDALQHDLGALLDTALFDATPADAGVRPAGLFNAATSVTPSAATPLAEAMMIDLAALSASVSTNVPDARPLFIMNPKQALRVSMSAPTFPSVIASGYVTPGTVGCVDANSIVMMLGDIVFAASSQATIHMENATPLAIGTAGVPNTVAAPTLSLFQANLLGLRSVLHVSWMKRRTAATARAVNVTW